MNSDSTRRALIIGAGSAIAKELLTAMCRRTDIDEVVAVSRDASRRPSEPRVLSMTCDYSAAGINGTANRLNDFASTFTHVFVCTGVLHNARIQPEKRLEDITVSQLADSFYINSIMPALWLQALFPVLRYSTRCVVTVFSARVGSISDNRKGGWYSYRASKAALNMLIKTASVEYARRAPGVKLMAFHPGTVDTDLSRPYQKNIPAEKLFTPTFVASQLLEITDNLILDGQASYLDWAGKPVPW